MKLMSLIPTSLTLNLDQHLRDLPYKGKAMDCVFRDKASSHFIRSGDFTRFADWRFVHRARINLLPVNGARPWVPNDDSRCRRCGFANETLPHVPDHCMTYSNSYRTRHNKIVERVKAAALGKYTVIAESTAVSDTALRPDLVLCRGEAALVLDITIPFDNRYEALSAARAEKHSKCAVLKQYYRRRFSQVSVEAIVLGALGSWDLENDKLMKKLCNKSYMRLFKKLCVSDVMASSRDTYVEHVTGTPVI
ncbi:uncharacterized protein LOC135372837 [Ornithodoros turicata]|uniref:uncharacterized protein LOC135372837 n=1 Tax=Ornithodoros turicata TaxID=34597 RepID=UPI0031393405